MADTHCHLNFNSFQTDLSETILRARDAGIEHILIPGTNLTTSKEAVELSDRYECMYAAVGIHPNDAVQWQPTTWSEIQALASHPKVLAIGEIGLDYYRDYAPPDVQRMVFQEQLNLASELNLPVIIHNRQAFSDVIQIVQNWYDHLKSTGS
ncbi:TatD family deoxyribonuclease, partial [bacterium]|nr:TatD family deoxyribonuclease [bacterium]